MQRKLTIYFTGDNHGYLSPLNYATGEHADTGLSNCMANYINDGRFVRVETEEGFFLTSMNIGTDLQRHPMTAMYAQYRIITFQSAPTYPAYYNIKKIINFRRN